MHCQMVMREKDFSVVRKFLESNIIIDNNFPHFGHSISCNYLIFLMESNFKWKQIFIYAIKTNIYVLYA